MKQKYFIQRSPQGNWVLRRTKLSQIFRMESMLLTSLFSNSSSPAWSVIVSSKARSEFVSSFLKPEETEWQKYCDIAIFNERFTQPGVLRPSTIKAGLKDVKEPTNIAFYAIIVFCHLNLYFGSLFTHFVHQLHIQYWQFMKSRTEFRTEILIES